MANLKVLIRDRIIAIHSVMLRLVFKMNIGMNTRISFKAHLDKTNPKGIFIGSNTYIAAGAYILTHDYINGVHVNTKVGDNCFIGLNSCILPGVTIGNECIIGALAVVSKDVPDRSIVVGNPGRIIRSNIRTKEWGRLL
jgi:acetyltransferase-like isoleucine patch superfamily enzyme